MQLYLRARLENGNFPYLKAALLPNDHVRPGYAISAGRAVKVTSGSYHLRYMRHGKRVWDQVGTEASLAEVALLRKRREFEDAEMGLAPDLTPVPPANQTRRLLADCIAKYLAEIHEHRERKTYAAYSKSLRSFAATTRKTCIEDLTRDDAMP